MIGIFMKLLLTLALVAIPFGTVAAGDNALAFHLADSDGKTFELNTETATDYTVVCFLGTECPLARLYGPRLSKMAADFADDSVQFVGINSNRQDSMADIHAYRNKYKVTFPILRDPGNKVADRFEATRTPEVFVLNQSLDVVYHGRIDDQYAPGVSRNEPARRDLQDALVELTAGKPVTIAITQPVGCFIGRIREQTDAPKNNVTYAEHVVPVLHRHCVECHREGEIGPFAMEEFDEIAGWADTMMETIDLGRMPPWHADPTHGDFKNARTMPEEDRQILRDWIAGGLAEGDLSTVPGIPKAVDGWQLSREPDLVIDMRDRPFRVPADGTVEYQYFVTDPGFTEDKWIVEAQSLPGNRSVVHHIIVYVRPPTLDQFSGIGWLTAYVPGQRLNELPPGRARKVPAGSKLVFQMHYTPNGESQDDLSKIGLIFSDAKDVTHEVYTLAAINQEFEIPPGAADHEVEAHVRKLPDEGELLGITPHMHYRGKSFRLHNGDTPNAPMLLNVPGYDFNWQHTYQLVRPLPISEIDRLKFYAKFDNSEANPFNPDAGQWVTWGDQTWEEMAVAFFDVSEPLVKTESATRPGEATATIDDERQTKIDHYVDRFFDKMDQNDDGKVVKKEVSIVVRRKSFGRFDRNGDNIVTRDEVSEVAEALYPEPK